MEGNAARQAAVAFQDVHKVFETGATRVAAVQGISLSVGKGEFVSVIGPSGCGKTTLLRLLGGLEVPTLGRVLVNGKRPELARTAREVGMVFQSPALLDWRTVEENVALPGEILRDKTVSGRAAPMIRSVGLEGFERAYPRELSGGMQSRVSIARALTYRPALLLMDEPFGALDEITRGRIQVELLRIWEDGRPTVFFVTHSIPEAILLADRAIVMSGRPGRILADVAVPFPRPRESKLRSDRRFAALEERLRGLLDG